MPDSENNGNDTRLRILAAAEVLFAKDGYECMSMRAVTRQACVNLAAVNYHFGSKRDLVMEMLRRHIDPINARRLEMLEAVRKESVRRKKLPLRPLVVAFIEPMLKWTHDAGEMHIFRMVGRCITAPAELDDAIYMEFFSDLVVTFLTALQEALPDVPEAVLRMRFHFMVSSLLGVMIRMGRIMHDGQTCECAISPENAVNDLCDFLTSAMSAPIGEEMGL